MIKEDVDITDYLRILFGNMPPEFTIETVIRVAFAYLLLVSVMRMLGPRMEAVISRHEEMALVTLAASAGIIIHNPDRGLLPAVVMVAVVVALQYASLWNMKRHDKTERNLLGVPQKLVSKGRFCLCEMRKTRIQRERIVAELRNKSLFNLAQVQRVYIEANGDFSILTYEEKAQRTGLCLLPDTDAEFRQRQHFSDTHSACKVCGNVVTNALAGICVRCGKEDWERAMVSVES